MRKFLLIAVAVLLLVPAAAFAKPYEGDDPWYTGTEMIVAEEHSGEVAAGDEAEDLGRFDREEGAGDVQVDLDRRDAI